MPLAIELAAGRLSTFSLADLRDRLDRSLDLLGGGRPSGDARHRTLRATVEWSYQLLTDDEQRLFRHLAGLRRRRRPGHRRAGRRRPGPGRRSRQRAGPARRRLHDRRRSSPAGTRYRMLETLRAFGLDRLAAAGEDERRAAAAAPLGGRADRLDRRDRDAPSASPRPTRALRRELPNLRAAWRLARDARIARRRRGDRRRRCSRRSPTAT